MSKRKLGYARIIWKGWLNYCFFAIKQPIYPEILLAVDFSQITMEPKDLELY